MVSSGGVRDIVGKGETYTCLDPIENRTGPKVTEAFGVNLLSSSPRERSVMHALTYKTAPISKNSTIRGIFAIINFTTLVRISRGEF